MANVGWNGGFGLKARTDDGYMGAIALSGALFSRCRGVQFPEAPRPPDADFRDDLVLGAAVQTLAFDKILRAAARAALRGSGRAFVLLENYRPRLIDAGALRFLDPVTPAVCRRFLG